MNDTAIRNPATRAGLAVTWRDYANAKHEVSIETLRRLLAALGLACETASDVADSLHRCRTAASPPLITATVKEPLNCPSQVQDRDPCGSPLRTARDRHSRSTRPGALRLAGIETPGYHTAEVDGRQITIAVAPPRCATVSDIAPHERIWGLVAQVYGLRSHGDFGIGDMAGVVALAGQAAALRADALALSPLHALFAADPHHSVRIRHRAGYFTIRFTLTRGFCLAMHG